MREILVVFPTWLEIFKCIFNQYALTTDFIVQARFAFPLVLKDKIDFFERDMQNIGSDTTQE